MTTERLMPPWSLRERVRGARLIVENQCGQIDGYAFATTADLLRWAYQVRCAYDHVPYRHDRIDHTDPWFASWAEAEAWLSGREP